ncbi:uncharacterized protein WM294_003286 isoform 3-T5 [Sarcoramphus papa]
MSDESCLVKHWMQRDELCAKGQQRRGERSAVRRWYPSLNLATCKQQRQCGRAAEMLQEAQRGEAACSGAVREGEAAVGRVGV